METTLFDRLKPEYKNRKWSYESLKWKLQDYHSVGEISLKDIWMMESEFLISLREFHKVFNLFQDEEA